MVIQVIEELRTIFSMPYSFTLHIYVVKLKTKAADFSLSPNPTSYVTIQEIPLHLLSLLCACPAVDI